MDKPFFPPTGKQVVPLSKLQDDDEPTIISQPNLLKRALRICVKKKRASIAVLQRAFDIGYEDAVKILDRMTEQGWIGKANGSRPRLVLNRAFEMIALWEAQEHTNGAKEIISVGGERDELLEEALRICVKKQSASTSILQQHLRIRHERAAAILKALERAGFVGKANGAKPRRVRGIAYATVLRWDKNK
jgi:DNA segregation ATPase FtsK/SpoIIIE-like protein